RGPQPRGGPGRRDGAGRDDGRDREALLHHPARAQRADALHGLTRRTVVMPTSERCGHVLPESGFLVVKRATERYRGVDRGALAPFTSNDRSLTHSVPLAETRLVELLDREYCSVCDCGFVASEHDAIDVLGWAELEDPGVNEIIWARVLGAVGAPPDDYERLG